MKKDNSIFKDVLMVLLTVVGFYLILNGATWFNNKFDFSQIFQLVDIAAVAVKVATASALAWVVKRVVFAKTLGKDFGKTFDSGWAQMSTVERARWTIVTFLVIFATILYISNGAPTPAPLQ